MVKSFDDLKKLGENIGIVIANLYANSNVLLIRHNDLDGKGNGVIMQTFANKFNFTLTQKECKRSADEAIVEYLDNDTLKEFDLIIISDLSVTEPVAKRINALSEDIKCKIKLIDHHASAIYLNEYEWACVIPHNTPMLVESGTSLLYKMIFMNLYDFSSTDIDAFDGLGELSLFKTCLESLNLELSNVLSVDIQVLLYRFASIVAAYDTFYFTTKVYKDKYNNETPFILNLVANFEGDKFIDRMIANIENDRLINGAEEMYVTVMQGLMDSDYEYIKSNMKLAVIDQYTVAFVYYTNQSFKSYLMNKILAEKEYIDFMIAFDLNTNEASLRTIRDDIQLNVIAKKIFNGGGHPKASGYKIPGYEASDVFRRAFANAFTLHSGLIPIPDSEFPKDEDVTTNTDILKYTKQIVNAHTVIYKMKK